MPAIVTICERNGTLPGTVVENINNLNWKAVDDTSTPISSYTTAIGLGTNSYTKYNYIRFSGSFTNVGNVSVTHLSGKLPKGVKLMSSPSITLDASKLLYAKPTRNKDLGITPTDFSNISSVVRLLVGPKGVTADPANAGNKLNIGINTSGTLFTNYFITQLQVSTTATTGNMDTVTLQITYDEV